MGTGKVDMIRRCVDIRLPEHEFEAGAGFISRILTRYAVAVRDGITPEGVKYRPDRLRKAGRLRHVGPTKKGRWGILESESTRP